MTTVNEGPKSINAMARAGDPLRELREALRGRYDVLGEIGRGNMGIVYLAHERALQRQVALKLLPPALAQPHRRERFFREARTVAKLSHPDIVPIFAVDQVGEFVFFTMPYIEGETLADRVQMNGPMPAGEVARVLRQVARAVAYAHDRGIVHRDLKPQNILLERGTGRALVLDFGIARMEAELREAKASVQVDGTMSYVSPERAHGLPGDERSDIYSLGITAFMAATGRLPFNGGTADEILSQHVNQPAPPLEARGRDGDDTLARVVARCLAKDPNERFQTCHELADELSKAPELRPDVPVSLRAFVGRLRRASRSLAGLSLLGGMAALALLKGLWNEEWALVAGAAGSMALVLVGPLAAVLSATRRVLKSGYGIEDMLRALRIDLDRRKEELAFEQGKDAPPRGRVARFVSYAGLGVAGMGALWLSFLEVGADIVFWVTVGGAVTAGVAGLIGVARVRRQNSTRREELWLGFWESAYGEWAVSVAGLGVGAVEPSADGVANEAKRRRKLHYHLPDAVRLEGAQVESFLAGLDGTNAGESEAGGEVKDRAMGV